MLDAPARITNALDSFYGSADGELHKLKGEASTRSYYRFRPVARRSGTPHTLIVMSLPEAGDARDAALVQAHAFLDVRDFLDAQGIAVPRVYAHDLAQGVMLLEDLGDETFEASLLRHDPASWRDAYARAIDLLADLHTRCAPPRPQDVCIAYRRTFDAALLRWELDHFREYGLDVVNSAVSEASRRALDESFDALTASIAALPTGFVHRDYQSRNLIWAPDGRLCVIDFQDAFIGPAPYDLVALLCDSYVSLDETLQLAMLERYFARRAFTTPQASEWLRGFRLIAAQRKLKDAGRFVFIDRVRGNPAFLPYFTQSLRYAARAMAGLPELSRLSSQLVELMPGFPEIPAPASIC